jgi:hypothetical protein
MFSKWVDVRLFDDTVPTAEVIFRLMIRDACDNW